MTNDTTTNDTTTNDTTNYYANWNNESSTMTNDTNENIILEPDSNPPTILEVSVGVLLEQAANGQAHLFQYLMGYISTLELRISALELNDEDEAPLTREAVSEMIGDRLEEFTSDYSFTSAVRDIADEVVGDIDWSSKIDAEEIVREGLRDIL